MSKYYKIPKKILNPRAVHLYDIPLVALIFAIALTLMPLGTTLDLSVGFNEKSEAYQAEQRDELLERFENTNFENNALETLFRGTTVQNGGYVYPVHSSYAYVYSDGKKGVEYYKSKYEDRGETGSAVTSTEDDMLRGLTAGESFVAVGEDGRIYFDDLDGLSGWTDSYIDLDAEVDYTAVAAIMNRIDSKPITLENAALIWSLIDRDILVGYSDENVMFVEYRDGMTHFIRATEDGTEEAAVVNGKISNVLVAEDNYLFYVLGGNVYIQCLETGDRTYLPMNEWTDLGTVRELAYVVYEDGSIRLYCLNSIKCLAVDLTGNGVENSGMHRYDDLDCSNLVGIQAFRLSGKEVALYFRASDGTYKCYIQNK